MAADMGDVIAALRSITRHLRRNLAAAAMARLQVGLAEPDLRQLALLRFRQWVCGGANLYAYMYVEQGVAWDSFASRL